MEMTSCSVGTEGSVSASLWSFASVPSVSSLSVCRVSFSFLLVAARPVELGAASPTRPLLRVGLDGVAMDSGVSASETSCVSLTLRVARALLLEGGIVKVSKCLYSGLSSIVDRSIRLALYSMGSTARLDVKIFWSWLFQSVDLFRDLCDCMPDQTPRFWGNPGV